MKYGLLACASLFLIPFSEAQTCLPGELRVVVVDSQDSPVFNANVTVAGSTAQSQTRSTATVGVAGFKSLGCGAWDVSVEAEGFQPSAIRAEVTSAANMEARIVLTPQTHAESVEVRDTIQLLQQSATANNELKPEQVKKLPTNPATVADVLPLTPGVYRGQDGELKIDGSGQERSAMVVNQTDITDPATGRFGQTVPIDSIDTVNVLQTPFLAQYGRFTQSVVAVETKRGGEKWHAELNDPFPDFRIRSYHLRGIRDSSPRFNVGGPAIKNKVYVMAAVQYFFNRDSVRTLPFPYNEARREASNGFFQADWIATNRLVVTATMHVSPQKANYVNLDYFNPQPVAPSFSQNAYNGTMIGHLGILGGILDSSVSEQRFNVIVGAQGPGDMIFTPTGNRGNYFGPQRRDARRTEWLETWSLAPVALYGTHLFKMGSSFTNTGNDGAFNYHNADIFDQFGVRTERISFFNPPPFTRSDREVTAYVQDHWSLGPKLAFDFGGRVEHQRLASSLRVAPRMGFAWSPFGQRAVLRAGYGLFYDHLPLDIYSFSRYPLRALTFYNPDGSTIGPPVFYSNVIGDARGPRSFFVNGQQVAGAFSPRGSTLNIQLEGILTKWFRARATYMDNRSVGLVVLERDLLGVTNEIVLNGDGNSRYRHFELTSRFNWKDGEMNVSYTHSRAEGNLNTFDTFLGNIPTLFVRPNIYTNTIADIPNRFLLWGSMKTHVWKLDLQPIVEVRTGFPYAALDAAQQYVGTPYRDDTRFPKFFSADARLSRDFKVNDKYTIRLSWTGTNLTSHFNALAVHNNIGDPQYGVFFGTYRRRNRGDFEVIF
jgi:hypothetical protein